MIKTFVSLSVLFSLVGFARTLDSTSKGEIKVASEISSISECRLNGVKAFIRITYTDTSLPFTAAVTEQSSDKFPVNSYTTRFLPEILSSDLKETSRIEDLYFVDGRESSESAKNKCDEFRSKLVKIIK